MRFSANVETRNWLLLKLLTLLIISSYIQSASIEKNADFYPKTSKFVKDLTKLTRHRRAVEGVTDNDVSILHPNISPIRSNLIRMFTRALGGEIDVQRSGNHRVPCGDCKLKKKMITIRKPNCSRTNVIIPICQGLCESWEIPHYEPPYVKRHHPVCRPVKTELKKVSLSGCNDVVIIKVPTRCECSQCDSATTSCKPLY